MDMKNKFVGLVPPDLFIDHFLPCSIKRPAKVRIRWNKKAVESEGGFVAAYSRARKAHPGEFDSIAPFDTKSKRAAGHNSIAQRQPDLTVYARGPGDSGPDRMEWDEALMTLDRKGETEDIVVDPHAKATPQEKAEHVLDACPNQDGNKSRGQFISYASQAFRSQPLLFHFSIILLKDKTRFIRWDRGGAVVSELFNWVKTDILTEFFWRANRASPEDLGRDPTVTPAAEADAEVARKALKDWSNEHPGFITPPKEDAPIWRVEVFDDAVATKAPAKSPITRPSPRIFFAARSHFSSESLTGRATSGYNAVEITPGAAGAEPATRVVFLKDSWRIALPGMEKEGDLYRAMEAAGVPNIAGLVCAGDVWGKDGKQRTRTRTIRRGKPSWYCSSKHLDAALTPHVHYRLVLDTIAKPLCRFESTWQLCSVIADAIEAHQAAFLLALILHRDISAGNIMITPSGKGILIDWDLSRGTEINEDARQRWRTGTWQFMSYALLRAPFDKDQNLADDLESFVWVLIYHVLRYRPTVRRQSVSELYVECYDLFDQCSYKDNDASQPYGGSGKEYFIRDSLFTTEQVEISIEQYGFPKPLARLIEDVRSLLCSFYPKIVVVSVDVDGDDEDDDDEEEAKKRVAAKAAIAATREAERIQAAEKLSSHKYLLKRMRTVLSRRERWPEKDSAMDHLPDTGKYSTCTATNNSSGTTSGKRKRASAMASKKRSRTVKSSNKSLQDSRYQEEEAGAEDEEVTDEVDEA